MPEEPSTPDLMLTPEEIQAVTNRPLDAELAAAIAEQVTDAVRDVCGWRVAPPAVETFTLSARSARLIMLPTLHVTEVVEVIDDGVVLVDGTDFDWDQNGTLERLTGGWSARRRKLQVTVRHGFEKCPGAISEAITAAVTRATLAPAGNVTGETTLGASVQYGRGPGGTAAGAMFLPHEEASLARYRIPRSR